MTAGVRRDVPLVAGLTLVGLTVVVAIAAQLLAPADPYAEDLRNLLQPPSWSHPFGTDAIGRDVLSRVLFGGRPALVVGVAATTVAVVLGVVLAFAGTAGGRAADAVIDRVADVQLSVPGLVLALLALVLFGASPVTVAIVIGLEWWPMHYRVLRDRVAQLRASVFVQASRMSGSSAAQVFVRHVLPHLMPVLAVSITFNVATAVLAETGLSYLGLGTQPPTPSWGLMISDGRTQLDGAWWLVVFPGLALVLFLVGVQLVGDALSRRSAATGRTVSTWV